MTGTNLYHMLDMYKFAVILSAEQAHASAPLNAEVTKQLTTTLNQSGLRYIPATGVYDGVAEQSFIVFCNSIFDVLRVECIGMNNFNQESVLVLDLEQDVAVLKYKEQALMIGCRLVPVDSPRDLMSCDNYTIVDGEYWVVI